MDQWASLCDVHVDRVVFSLGDSLSDVHVDQVVFSLGDSSESVLTEAVHFFQKEVRGG